MKTTQFQGLLFRTQCLKGRREGWDTQSPGLCRPDRGRFRPDALGIFGFQIARQWAEAGVIVGPFIVADAGPIHSFGGGGFGKAINDLLVDALSISPVLLHECETRLAGQQAHEKLVSWKIAFNAVAFVAVGIEKDDPRRPQSVELVEDGTFLLDVEGKRDEGLVDVVGYFRVAVGFGFQPNTTSSGGSGGEIEQRGLVRLSGFGESGVQVVFPMD